VQCFNFACGVEHSKLPLFLGKAGQITHAPFQHGNVFYLILVSLHCFFVWIQAIDFDPWKTSFFPESRQTSNIQNTVPLNWLQKIRKKFLPRSPPYFKQGPINSVNAHIIIIGAVGLFTPAQGKALQSGTTTTPFGQKPKT